MYINEIHNYYEQLVHDHIFELLISTGETLNEDFLEDIACVALNKLPAKYVRHSVDLIFYMSAQELEEMRSATKKAVIDAIDLVKKHRDGPAKGVTKKKKVAKK